MSTFPGFIEEIDGISVDRFLEENAERSTAFFLSHCHAGLLTFIFVSNLPITIETFVIYVSIRS